MGRRPKAAVTIDTVDQPTVEAPVVVRRRRRRVVDHAAQTALLVESLLKTRGNRGASQEELQTAIHWARSVHAEAEEFKTLESRPRRQKALASPDRIATYELNKALLDSVLSGSIGIDVNESGSIVFISPA